MSNAFSLLVMKIAIFIKIAPTYGILCVDTIGSPDRGILCVDKIGSVAPELQE